MPAQTLMRRGTRDEMAAALVRLLQPAALVPAAHARWGPVIEALLEGFLRHFDEATLRRLTEGQAALPPSASRAERAVCMAAELTSLHKVCQLLARNEALAEDVRATLAPM